MIKVSKTCTFRFFPQFFTSLSFDPCACIHCIVLRISSVDLWCCLGVPRVLQLLLLSTSGCKFSFQVAVFLQSVDELLAFVETRGVEISFATCQPVNRYEYINVQELLRSQQRRPVPPPLLRHGRSACIKILPVLTSTRRCRRIKI